MNHHLVDQPPRAAGFTPALLLPRRAAGFTPALLLPVQGWSANRIRCLGWHGFAQRTRGRLGAIVACACLAGCTTLPGPAVKRLKEADAAYRANELNRADELCTSVIKAHSDKPDVAEAFYLRGLCKLKNGQTAPAAQDFNVALNKTPRRELRGLARAQLGNIDFEQGRYQSAVVHYGHAGQDLPNEPPKDRVGLQHGIALQRLGRFRDAQPVLSEVFNKFPQSSFAVDARRRFQWPYEYFTIQCGAFADIARANQQAIRLQALNVSAVATPEGDGDSRLYCVRVGRYASYAEAEDALPTVRRAQSDAFIQP